MHSRDILNMVAVIFAMSVSISCAGQQHELRSRKMPDPVEYRKLFSYSFTVDAADSKKLPSRLQSQSADDRIEIVSNNGQWQIKQNPGTLSFPYNYLRMIPLVLPSLSESSWKLEVNNAMSGDVFRMIHGTLLVQTVSPVSHTVELRFSAEKKEVAVPLTIAAYHKRGTPFFGVQDHFDRFPPGPTRKALDDMTVMQSLPVQLYRLPLAWPFLERREGQDNKVLWDWYIDAVRKRGQLKVQAGIGRIPRWLGRTEDLLHNSTLLQRYRENVATTVKHFGDRVDYWGTGNEPLAFWWKKYIGRKPQQYVDDRGEVLLLMIKESSAIIRRYDPDALILSPAFINSARKPEIEINGRKRQSVSYRMFEWLLKNGMAEHVDAVNMHVYPLFKKNNGMLPPMEIQNIKSWRDLDRRTDNSELLALLDRYSVNKPIWVTEYNSIRLGKNPTVDVLHRQALALLRVSTILAHQRGEGLFFFELFDYTHTNDLTDSYLYRNLSHEELPAFAAYRVIINLLTGATPFFDDRFRGSREKGDDYSGIVYKMFNRPDEDIIVLWSNRPTATRIHIQPREKLKGENVLYCRQSLYGPGWEGMDQDILSGEQVVGEGIELILKPFELLTLHVVTSYSGFKWLDSINEKTM